MVGVLAAEAQDEAVHAGAKPGVVGGAHTARNLVRQRDELVARHLKKQRRKRPRKTSSTGWAGDGLMMLLSPRFSRYEGVGWAVG